MSPLYRRIHRWAAQPFVWGESDCVLVLFDHVRDVLGRDPGVDVRGTYMDAASCQRVTGFLRDPVAAVEACLETIGGLERVERPEPGDIAIVRAQCLDVAAAGALWMGSVWACKAPSGVTTIDPRMVEPLAIWRVR